MSFSQRMLPWSVGLALLMSVLMVAASYMVVDIDLFHEMALFRQFLAEGSMPLTDDFAYTPTLERVVHHEWGTGAVLYGVTVATGWGAGGIVALKYILCFGIGLGCFFYCRSRGTTLPLFAILSFVAINLGGWMAFTNVRAQLFTLAFLVGLFCLIHLDQQGKRWWIAVWIPMCILWSNMHAGVVSGIGILAIYAMAQTIDTLADTRSPVQTLLKIKHLLLAGMATAIAININPYGLDYVPYLVRAIRMDRPLISEWSPLWQVGSMSTQIVFLASLLIAAYAIVSQQKRQTFETLALALTAYLAMKHLRHGSLYAVCWICLVPPLLEHSNLAEGIRRLWGKQSDKILMISLACSLIAIGCSVKMKFWQLRIPTEPTIAGLPIFPEGAVSFLRQEKFRGNLFVPFQTGAFVSWNLYPDVKVSVDSRYEVAYPDGAVEENWKFYLAKNGWQTTLEKYDTDAILVPVNQAVFQELERSIEQDPEFGWHRVYQDRGNALFMRADISPQTREAKRSDGVLRAPVL